MRLLVLVPGTEVVATPRSCSQVWEAAGRTSLAVLEWRETYWKGGRQWGPRGDLTPCLRTRKALRGEAEAGRAVQAGAEEEQRLRRE